MNKILVIIPYFGKLPNYFQAFLNSCKKTKILNFLLITDDKSIYSYPHNFIVEYWSFSKMQELIKSNLGQNAYIKHPYKLCDYRPLYGHLFEKELKNYDFWAHADIDIIFGDIDTFLYNIEYVKYDRIFPYGHFSIYKNSSKINMLFAQKLPQNLPRYFDVDFVKQTTYPCHFDEVGVNIIIKNNKLKFFEGKKHINTNINFYNLCIGPVNHEIPCLIVYDGGKILTVEKVGDRINKKEFLYVHLQSKRFVDNLLPQTNHYVICSDGFIDYEKGNENVYFKKYGLNNDKKKQADYIKQLDANTKKGKKQKILREIQEYPVRGIYNIFHRFMSIIYLKRNNLF